MKDELKHIESLYEGLDSGKVSASKPDWYDMAPKVNKLNFFRFNLASFNVFYASLISLAFIFTGYLTADNLFTKRFFKEDQQLPHIVYDTLVLSDTTTITDTVFNYFSDKRDFEPAIAPITSSYSRDTVDAELVLQEKADSDNTARQKTIKSNEPAHIPKKIKKVTIVKRKQVVMRDTVVLNKLVQ